MDLDTLLPPHNYSKPAPVSPSLTIDSSTSSSESTAPITSATVSEILKDYFDPSVTFDSSAIMPPTPNPIMTTGTLASPATTCMSSPSSAFDATMSPISVASFLDSGFPHPVHIPSPVSPVNGAISLCLAGVSSPPVTLPQTQLVFALDFIQSSNAAFAPPGQMTESMRGVLKRGERLSTSNIISHTFRVAVDASGVYAGIKADEAFGRVQSKPVISEKSMKSMTDALTALSLTTPQTAPTLESRLEACVEGGREKVKKYEDMISRACAGRERYNKTDFRVAAYRVLEFQQLVSIVEVLKDWDSSEVDRKIAAETRPSHGNNKSSVVKSSEKPVFSTRFGPPTYTSNDNKTTEKTGISNAASIESILGLSSSSPPLSLPKCSEKAALALASANRQDQTHQKSGKSQLDAPMDSHTRLFNWWTGSQDLASLEAIFSTSPASLSQLLRVYTETRSWKRGYAAEIMAQAFSVLVDLKLAKSRDIADAITGQKQRLQDDAIPDDLKGLVRVLIVNGVLRLQDWTDVCMEKGGDEPEFVDGDGSYAQAMNQIHRPVLTLTFGRYQYSW